MIKSCRRYWSGEIADSIVQLKDIRFDNPMFSLSTTFDRAGFHPAAGRAVPRADGKRRSVFRRRAQHELLRRSDDDDRPTLRAVLSRPRRRCAAADGADHLRQRLDARRPRPDLRHRLLELHVEGRLHVSGRNRPADRSDGPGIAAKAASTCERDAPPRRSTRPGDASRA